MLVQHYAKRSWFYDPVTNGKKCITDKMKKNTRVWIHAMLHKLAQSTVKSQPAVHRPFLFHASRLRADSDPMQPGLDEKQHSWK